MKAKEFVLVARDKRGLYKPSSTQGPVGSAVGRVGRGWDGLERAEYGCKKGDAGCATLVEWSCSVTSHHPGRHRHSYVPLC